MLYPAFTISVSTVTFGKTSPGKDYIRVGWFFRKHSVYQNREYREFKDGVLHITDSIAANNKDTLDGSSLYSLDDFDGIPAFCNRYRFAPDSFESFPVSDTGNWFLPGEVTRSHTHINQTLGVACGAEDDHTGTIATNITGNQCQFREQG